MSAAAQEVQDEVLAAITPALLAADVARLVRVPSPTGAERPAVDDDRGPATEIRWHSGQVAPAQTPVDDPFVALVHAAAREQCSPESSVSGVPYGADMRHFCARGIPCVMLGPPGFERAHAADEFVSVDDLVRVARAIAVTILRFGS